LKTWHLICFALILGGCATKKVEVVPVSIEPVQTIKSDPFDVDEVFADAQNDYVDENYLDALNGYKKVFAYDPDRRDALSGQAKSYLALGEYKQASQIYWDKSWAHETPRDVEFLIGKTLSGVYSDRYDDPIGAINDGMVLSPNDARLWNAKGHYHDKQAEWMDALASYVEALKSGKWQAGTVNNMGMSLLLQDRLDEAEAKFEQAIELAPGIRVYENNLRMVYILKGDLEAALDNINDTRSADILNDAGYVAMTKDKDNLASRLFAKALEISPVFHAQAQANLDKLDALKSAARSESSGTSP